MLVEGTKTLYGMYVRLRLSVSIVLLRCVQWTQSKKLANIVSAEGAGGREGKGQ